jgi:hypothetical protein
MKPMKQSNHLAPRAMLAAALLVTMPAVSVGSYAATSQIPPEQRQGNVTYVSGGIGRDESAAMRREESQFPLTLEFVQHAKPNAEYVAAVNVIIKDHQGKTMLNTLSEGPLLFAKLPDGKYTVTAEDNGKKKERSIIVSEGKPEHVVFEW